MPRTCSICTHDQRDDIDTALLSGGAFRNIAERFGTSTTVLHRHKNEHLGERMAQVAERNVEADVRTALDVVAQLKTVNDETHAVLKAAKKAKDGGLALQAIDRITRQIELQAKLIDLIRDGDTINIIVAPEWQSLRVALFAALDDYPDARLAAAKAFTSVEGNDHRALA